MKILNFFHKHRWLFFPFFAAYPFIIFYMYKIGMEPRWMSLALFVLLLGQLLNKENVIKKVYLTVWFCLILLLIIMNSMLIAQLYPVIINLALLSVFALSLKNPPTVAERFARLKHGDALPEKAVLYCRKVTQVWCGFFVLNIFVSAMTLFMSIKIWTLYNGLISYIMMGTIFIIEYIVRNIYETRGSWKT